MSGSGYWFVRGIGKQTQLIGKPTPPVSVAVARITSEHQYNGPSSDPDDDDSSSSETPLPASPRTSQSEGLDDEEGRPPSPQDSLAAESAFAPTPNTTRQHSLHELEGVLDLIIISFLTSVPTTSLIDRADTSNQCTHCRCPANCAECTALSRKNWGVREKKLSIDAKITRSAQVASATLSLVCSRWHSYIRKPQSSSRLWSRLSLRTIKASNGMVTGLSTSFGAFIRSVDLSNQKILSDEAIYTVLVMCGSLESLSARRCPKLRGLAFNMSAASSLPPLKFLTLSGCDTFNDRGLNFVGKYFGGSLETLNISGCKSLTGKGLKSVGRHCKKIVSIDAGGLKDLKRKAILSLLKKTSPTLRSLNVGGCTGEVEDDEWIWQTMGREFHDCLLYRR
ncbi:hypothetical protein TrVE_jg9293 [Triparma verrucosa]|uniref:Uncharacterized protein n=1 Tax=Triparma verrucosa TaxID=1606542 RepID=A0A9W7CPH2_9STRA|nr:hypothetical protein TrVE_jg9293 [Triparma verrucosa]